ncbi:MAG: ferritin-like domain-containing protein [Acidimicrobiales bacterium]
MASSAGRGTEDAAVNVPAIPRTREQLIHMLTHAAETEHMLCCQYLFAALSLKHRTEDGLDYEQQRYTHDWAQLILLIARQEMEHLGLACNLLTSVGGSPYFDRANFPQDRHYFPVPMALEKFGMATLDRFLAFERPATWEPEPSDAAADDFPTYVPVPFKTIGQLYEQIAWLIDNIDMSEPDLFMCRSKRQVSGTLLHIDWPRPGALGGVFDATLFDITDRKTAHQAIDLIIAQGEGTPDEHNFTHYKWFQQTKRQLTDQLERDPAFEPAHALAENPGLFPADDSVGVTIITNPLAREVMGICDGVYELLLLLLAGLYAYNDSAQQDILALQYTLFPLMTQVFRPISEVLIGLPAFDDDDATRAAPGFQVDRSIPVLPHRDAMFAYLTERFLQLSVAAKQTAASGDARVHRLGYIGINLEIMGNKFRDIAAGTYPEPLMQPGVVLPFAQAPSAQPPSQ